MIGSLESCVGCGRDFWVKENKASLSSSIGEDFSLHVGSVRGLLWKSSLSNRNNGERVSLSYDKLKINKELYVWDFNKNDKVKLGSEGQQESRQQTSSIA